MLVAAVRRSLLARRVIRGAATFLVASIGGKADMPNGFSEPKNLKI